MAAKPNSNDPSKDPQKKPDLSSNPSGKGSQIPSNPKKNKPSASKPGAPSGATTKPASVKLSDDDDRKRGKKRLFKIILILIVLIVGYVLISRNITFVGGFPIFKKKTEDVSKQAVQDIPLPVKGFKVARVDFTDNLPALGTVKGYHEIELKFSESGYVEYINFKDGEKVIEGDIIASLDQREALLKLEYSKNELERDQLLLELGSITEMKADQTKLEYQSARIEYEKTNLIAPYDGFIGTMDVERGDFLTPSDVVGSFVNLSDAYVEFGIIEKDIAKIKVGQPATMVVDSHPRDTFSGEIESVSPIVEGKARTFKVKGRITNEDEKLKAGMFGRVAIQIYEKQNALVIPSSAFKKKGDEYFVYVVHPEEGEGGESKDAGDTDPQSTGDENAQIVSEKAPESDVIIGSVEIRPIQIAYTTPDAVEIKAGLEEEELIVADIQQDFEEKARVEVTEVQENIF